MLFESVFAKLKARMEHPWFGRLMFVLLATFLWFLIKLSNSTFLVTVTIPLEFQEAPAGKITDSIQARFVQVEVETQGYHYFTLNYSDFDPFIISFEDLKFKEINKKHGIFTPSTFQDEFAALLGKGSVIVKYEPDTIHFEFLNKKSKRVPVVLESDWHYFNAYRPMHDPILSPDSVTLYGPEKLLDTIQEWHTVLHKLQNVKTDIAESVALLPTHGEELELSTNMIRVKQEIDLFTQVDFEVNIQPFETSSNLTYLPNKGKISLNVPFKKYEKYSANQFTLFFHLNNTRDGRESIFPSELPEGVELLDYSPKSIQWWHQNH